MAESGFTKRHKELSAHLKCDEHSNERYCWVPGAEPHNGKVHIPLDPLELELWAKGLQNATATKFNPPETELFWKLRAKYNPENPRRGTSKRRPQTPEERHQDRDQRIRLEFANGPHCSHAQYPPAYPPATPRHGLHRRSNSHEDTSTPIKGFHPRDYYGAGLQTFLSWMTEYYGDDDYVELLSVLREHKIGIDLFKKAMHNSTQTTKLERKLEKIDIKIGMVDRLMMDFKTWYAEHVQEL